jgi:LmbE family N-acetylglucosaminyl deacetylase
LTLSSAAERAWTLGFAAAQMLRPARGVSRALGDASRVLVIAPHPDDESIGCAGAIVLHRRTGARVVVLCATDGRTSRAFGLGPDEMAARRYAEAMLCTNRLDVDLDWLGLPGGVWRDDDLATGLASAITRHRPQLVYAPSAADFHPEHRRVAQVLGGVWETEALRPDIVRIYPVQVPLTAALANVVLDVDVAIPRARDAMDAYATQIANIERAFRQRRYTARRHRAGRYAEEFWQMDAAIYSRLHRDVGERVEFRGVRPNAVFDPFAYLVGAAARRRLARVVAAQETPA